MAGGAIGFIFFIWWMFRLFQCSFQLSRHLRRHSFDTESIVLDGLRVALIAELLILILSQNILRPYLWILIGMLNALYFRFKPLVFPVQVKKQNHRPDIELSFPSQH